MADQKTALKLLHNVIMNNCEKLSLTGIRDVEGFDENEITCVTDKGELLIRGENLHVDRVELSVGDVDVSGNISALIYTGSSGKKNGIFSKLFRWGNIIEY